MSRYRAILAILILSASFTLAQTFTLEARISHLPSFTQEIAGLSHSFEFESFNLIGGAVYCNLQKPLPLSVGIAASFGRKTLLDYQPSAPVPPGTGPTDMSRKIRLTLIEVPLLYRFEPLSPFSLRGGLLIGHVSFTRLDHLLGKDYETVAYKVMVSPEVEAGVDLPMGLRLAVGLEYRPLKLKLDSSTSYETVYSLEGFWSRVSLGVSN